MLSLFFDYLLILNFADFVVIFCCIVIIMDVADQTTGVNKVNVGVVIEY